MATENDDATGDLRRDNIIRLACMAWCLGAINILFQLDVQWGLFRIGDSAVL
jgi:hypothetical protein